MNARNLLNRLSVGAWTLSVAAVATSASAQTIKKIEPGTTTGSISRSAQVDNNPDSEPKSDGPASGAKIVVQEPTHDFGEVWSGGPIEHTYIIKNEGTDVLKITKVKPSCGCTVANQYDREIAPGATGKIPVSMKSAKLRNKVSKSITVESNDATNSPLRLTITGTVKQRIDMDPARGANFGRIDADQDLSEVITLINNTETPVELNILGADKSGPFSIDLKPIEEGKKYELKITGKAPFAEQANRGQFKLRTNFEEQPTIDIPVTAFVPPRVEIRPAEIIIPQAVENESQRNLTIKFNAGTDIQVLSGAVDAENVAVEIDKRSDNQYRVVAKFPPNYLPPTTEHKLTLKTDDPKNPEITIPIKRQREVAQQRPARPAEQLANKPAPDASFTMTDGKTVSVKDYEDKVTLMMYYASWCGFCKRAMPKLDELRKELDGKPFEVIAVSMDTIVDEPDPANKRAVTRDHVIQQFTAAGWDVPQAFDTNRDGSNKFKVSSFPTMFLLGKDSKVERVYVGGGAVNDGSMKSDINTLIDGKTLKPQEVAAAPAKPQRPAMEMKGKKAPTAALATTTGESFPLVDGENATVAFFYASWCGYCKKALPKLEELSKSYEGKNVRFVGVSQDTIVEEADPKNRRAVTKEFVMNQWKDLGATFPQIIDESSIGRSELKVSSFPTMFLIEPSGKISEVYIGGGAVDNGALKKDIDKVIAAAKAAGA